MLLLPAYVFENNLPNFLATISSPPDERPLRIDFSRAKYFIPVAVAALIARIDHAQRNGVRFAPTGLEQCENLRYLQRIDFFEQLGVELPENFRRHDAGTAFVPIREIEPGPVRLTNDPTATELARCVANGDDNEAFYLSEYTLGEVIANLRQHAGERGFVCAQYSPKLDRARIGIADTGIGIGESYRRSSSPQYRPGMDDLQILELAMAAWSSSKAHWRGAYGESANKGVGLTMVRFMVAESYGHFFLASGEAWWMRDGLAAPRSGILPHGCHVQGTIVGASYQRDQVVNYAELRAEAWKSLELTDTREEGTLFT
jgi:hypothetical protein